MTEKRLIVKAESEESAKLKLSEMGYKGYKMVDIKEKDKGEK